MIYKEEGTALLLTQDELSTEDYHKVKCAKPNSFIAATLAVSCLCGAGIFISTDKVWCYEPGISYREKELLRFYVIIGGILSALLSGRAVDFFGRRSSVIFAAVCWLLSAVFLSYFAILQTNSQSQFIEVSTEHLKSHQPSEISHSPVNSSGKYIHVSQSLLVNINPIPTKPASDYSLSSKVGSNVPEAHYDKWYFTGSPCEHSKINSLSRSGDVNEQPLPLLPQIITSLLIGGASSASIISASVYVFEISRAGTPFSFTHIIKPPFYFPKSKVYVSNSRKNSASDSDDVHFSINDVKQSELEVEVDKSQMAEAESQELSTNHPRISFEEDIHPQSNISMKSVRDKEADGLSVTDCCNSDYDEGVLTFGSTQRDREARETLSYLYGTCEGEDEAEAIHKEFLMDKAGSQCKNGSYLNMEMKNFHSITHTVLKLGFPLLIIHMCATDYNDVATLTSAVLSKLSIYGSTATAAVSMLKIISAALSMLLLDKIGHKRALMSAAAVLAISSLLLGFLSSHVIPDVQDHPYTASVTTLPSIPTMYPLLPTPLPQLLQRRDSSHFDDEWNDSHFYEGRVLHSHSASGSPVVWLTLILVISVIASGSILLAPLTRVCILSTFPTYSRGSGIGFTFAMQYVIHLIMFFLPCTYFSSSFTLMFRSGACFASIILLLCFLKTKNQGQRCSLQRYSFHKKFHLLFNGKICNMSLANSTAV
ncbi:hypothetical protein J437_LFUL017060 [Ladona fulva]|uniref:Uncharacterized protein n=1 Tax=Ladona fulva TaxID=123851 RepID=A0A8K0KL45_LADFU|nr:hypothetical protein J437_LFUL017060 [Ladona fulva]